MAHRVVWFDLPVTDLGRASAFYRAVLAVEVEETVPGVAVLESESGEVSGCLYCDAERAGGSGPLLYFNVDGRLAEAAARVTEHGGALEQAPASIGEHGVRAVATDPDGNRIALHARAVG